MKARFLTAVMVAIIWVLPGIAEERKGGEQGVSQEDLKEMGLGLEPGADLETRSATLKHTGTITEIHVNILQKENRGACIKMNPTIPGRTPWACQYWAHLSDPRVNAAQGLPVPIESYWAWMRDMELRRLIPVAFESNKKCTIWYRDAGTPKLNFIVVMSCYNQ